MIFTFEICSYRHLYHDKGENKVLYHVVIHIQEI